MNKGNPVFYLRKRCILKYFAWKIPGCSEEEKFPCPRPLFFVSYFYGLAPSFFQTVNLFENFFAFYPFLCCLQCLRYSSNLFLSYLGDDAV
jgi:hypothetical protein